MTSARLLACIFVAGVVPTPLRAQCPDGSPPPCDRARPRAVAAASARTTTAPDPQRIAVLPFRVTTADSLLGEGLAELIATEFTGESGPRAVNMGTVLRAWRGAGGGLRSPLAQDRAIRLASELGAGFYVEGSIVGLGPRLTINASIVAVPGGEARRAPAVAGPADSLGVLLGRLNSSLLAAAGSERAAAERARLTDSPAAMRSYLEGLALWRAGNPQPAATAFERALEQDTGFARAAFMRWIVGGWLPGGTGPWGRRAWNLRERLSASDRLLLVAQLGADYPQARPLAQRLADRQRAADQLPESAEAQYFYGDYLYHWASVLDAHDALPRAVAAFERSVALDSQATVLQHLVEIALFTGDTALASRSFAGFERVVGSAWDWGMAVAALRGDQGMLAAQRRRAGPIGARPLVAYVLPDAVIPATSAVEIFDLADQHVPADSGGLRVLRYFFETVHGRPASAMRLGGLVSGVVVAGTRDALTAMSALLGDGDRAAGAGALGRLRVLAGSDTTAAGRQAACLVALGDFQSGPAGWNEDLVNRTQRRCAAVLEAARAVRARSSDALERLTLADSVVRHTLAVDQPGFEHIVLARAWEAHGDLPRALAVVRVRTFGLGPLLVEAARCREEGRLAALAGDTAGAVAAYRRYLALRQDAEPALIPQRDSVRAEVARLTAR